MHIMERTDSATTSSRIRLLKDRLQQDLLGAGCSPWLFAAARRWYAGIASFSAIGEGELHQRLCPSAAQGEAPSLHKEWEWWFCSNDQLWRGPSPVRACKARGLASASGWSHLPWKHGEGPAIIRLVQGEPFRLTVAALGLSRLHDLSQVAHARRQRLVTHGTGKVSIDTENNNH